MSNQHKAPDYLNNAFKVIDAWLAYQRFFTRCPGIAVGIVYKDRLVFSQGYGYADLKSHKKITNQTGFRIASISKHFTAIAIMQLAETQKLHLDDKIQKYLPWFKGSDKYIDKVTIRQLLSHSSGIIRDGYLPHWIDDKFPSLKEIKNQLKKGVMIYSPLERFKYSNFGFSILGEIIHVVSGKKYEAYIKDSILKPLGMTHTYPDLTNEALDKLASGYYRDIPGQDRPAFKHVKTNGMASATGFISNIVDLAKFVSALFEGNNKLISDISKREMQKVHWKRKEDKDYGLGTEIWNMDGRQIVGHHGIFAGFYTVLCLDKEQELGVILLTNTNGPLVENLAAGIYHIINFFKDHDNEYQPTHKSSKFNKLEGLYSSRFGDLQIVNINGHLLGISPNTYRPLKEPYKLKHLKGYEFKAIDAYDFDYPGESVKFISNKAGKVIKVFIGPNPIEKKVITQLLPPL